MSNKIETVSIGDLPIATELDDADELLLRDASASLPEQATSRLSIATLRAAMGSPDRIESASGEAFVESTDDFGGSGVPASTMRAKSNDSSAQVFTVTDPGDDYSAAYVSVGPEGNPMGAAGFSASYDTSEGAYYLQASGAPLRIEEPTDSNHAATKGYVDARPGADAWSEHAATQDVDLDGHKITGLGEPTDAADAATKGYVDGAAPAKIERTFAWGRSVAEVTDDGNVDLAVYLSGQTAPLRRVRVPHGNAGGSVTIMNRSGMGGTDWATELLLGTVSPSFRFGVSGGPSGGASSRGGISFNQGVWRFTEQNGAEVPLGSNNYYTLPAGVGSIKHGIHLAKEAYDTLAGMPASPELEWWAPTWTPVSNVDSVSNVECSYTRTYRAAGGSLVTLEGTIEVESLGAGQCAVQVNLPVARVGSGLLAGTAMAMEVTPPGHVVAVASVGSTTLTLGFDAEGADPYLVGFRASYRAA